MNNKVVNKQIPLETIVKVANNLENYKEKYDRKFELEQNKNKNIPYGEKQWEYENGNTTINYTIEFKNGKNIKESDYNWFVDILLGNVFSYWYILSVYKPLLPETKYAGYNYSTGRGNYTDDVDDYIEHSEVHFGKYWDAEKRRTKIEKIYKITSKIILVQLLISVILFFIIK